MIRIHSIHVVMVRYGGESLPQLSLFLDFALVQPDFTYIRLPNSNAPSSLYV